MADDRLLESARRLAASLKPGDLDDTLKAVTAASVEVIPGVHYASITVLHADGSLGTTAPTDLTICDLDALQYTLQEGPCYDSAVDTVHVTSSDLAADPRFPRYGPAAVEAGICAQAAVRLFDTPQSKGALNLYSRDVGAFSDLQSLAELFAHQAATAIGYAQEIDNLQEAMRTRKLIGQAMGIVMERHGLTDERAFAFLSRLSQHRNVKLRLVAQEIVAQTEERGEHA